MLYNKFYIQQIFYLTVLEENIILYLLAQQLKVLNNIIVLSIQLKHLNPPEYLKRGVVRP